MTFRSRTAMCGAGIVILACAACTSTAPSADTQSAPVSTSPTPTSPQPSPTTSPTQSSTPSAGPDSDASSRTKPDWDLTVPAAALRGRHVGDLTPQWLYDVAAAGRRVVAVGEDQSDNVTRPLFLVSADAGKTWHRGRVTSASLRHAGPFEHAIAVTHGKHGFVAVGAGQRPVVWTSKNGQTWHRLRTHRAVFGNGDSIGAVTATPSGYIAAGTNSVNHGNSQNSLVIWTSADGHSWTRHSTTDLGLEVFPGSMYVSRIEAKGDLVILAGGREDNTDNEQPNRIVIWRSTDGGKTWHQVPTARDLAGDYRAYLTGMSVVDGTFYAGASGNGSGEKWDGVILTGGKQGAAWRTLAEPKVLGTAHDDYGGTVSRVDGMWVVTGETSHFGDDVVVATGSRLDSLTMRHDDTLAAKGDQSINSAASSGNSVVLVGSSSASGTAAPMVWRVTRGGVHAIHLPGAATGGKPPVTIVDVARKGRSMVVVGYSGNEGLVWRVGPGTPSAPALLPGLSAPVSDLFPTAVSVSPDGSLAIAGSVGVLPRGRLAELWTKKDDQHWRRHRSPAFDPAITNKYGNYYPIDIASGPDGWVMVGQLEENGHVDGAAWFSKNGKTWTKATGYSKVKPVGNDRYEHRPLWKAFYSAENGGIQLSRVVHTSAGFVAAGTVDNGQGPRPAVWKSPDGRHWHLPQKLPVPAHTTWVHINSLVRTDRTLVATGSWEPEPGHSSWMSWVSHDNGKTWKHSKPMGGQQSSGTVLRIPHGFLSVGETGPKATSDAAAWTSQDGLHWKRIDLELHYASKSGGQAIVDGVVVGNKLWVVEYDLSSRGGGHHVERVDVPTP